jgi:hypothetical protein
MRIVGDEQEVVRIVVQFERQSEADEKKMLGFLASTKSRKCDRTGISVSF